MHDTNYDDSCAGYGRDTTPPQGEREPEMRVGARPPVDTRHFAGFTASDFTPTAHVVEPQFHGAWLVGEDHTPTVATSAESDR